MAITLIKGRPGSGKSYECVVHHILPVLKDGRKVVTNVPLNVDHFVLVLGEEVRDLIKVYPFDFDDNTHYLSSPDDYKEYKEWRNDKGQAPLFVLDECHLLFPSAGRGKRAADIAEKQIKFFSGHRHWGFDFILMTQSDRKMNRTIREDIEICIEVRKNRAIGDKSYRRYVFYYGEGKRAGLIEQGSRDYEDKYFSFYKSHTKSEGAIEEAGIKDLKKWHQHWFIKIAIIMLVFGIFLTINNLVSIFGDKHVIVEEPVIHTATYSKLDDAPVETKPKKVSFSGLPFGKFEMFIEGYSDSSYTDNNGIYHIQKQVYFSAVKSKFQLDLKLDDLYLAGYDVSVYGPCLVRLNYGNASKLIYCRGKTPKDSSVLSDVSNVASL